MIDDLLLHLFHSGQCVEAYKIFGAKIMELDGVEGVRFSTYAPNAKRIQVIGDFNNWNGENHEMQRYYDGGVWVLFIPGLKQWDSYKYRIQTGNDEWLYKADPYATFSELRPGTASKVFEMDGYKWKDKSWMSKRTKNFDKPVNIYEMHLGSWRQKGRDEKDDPIFYSYEELIDILVPYVKDNGFTHVEIMPILEHPFDGSWGYQDTGFFSATSRYGNPKQLMMLVDAFHKAGIGVIMDFVPIHFVKDSHGLYRYDGGFVYEYPNPNQRYTEWGSVSFDLGREEVRSFIMSSVNFWITYFHFDGIRFDAISNLIYWKGNKSIGENGGAIEFIKRLNYYMNVNHQGVMLIAEDSSDYGKVTHNVQDGGLGFDYKWDLGWMNDTLKYLAKDPIYRPSIHYTLTFSMMYFYSENFILPFSHDEVVHSKATILDKMYGLQGEKFDQRKALQVYMMTHPGKKLNFMGNELALYREWDESQQLDWFMEDYPLHASYHKLTIDLNNLYKEETALHAYDYDYSGFEWIDADNVGNSIYSYLRKDEHNGEYFITFLNFTCQGYADYGISVPIAGEYIEVFNTDDVRYGGKGNINPYPIKSDKIEILGRENSIKVNIPPFSGLIIKLNKKQ